jgi:hypothetical protein
MSLGNLTKKEQVKLHIIDLLIKNNAMDPIGQAKPIVTYILGEDCAPPKQRAI